MKLKIAKTVILSVERCLISRLEAAPTNQYDVIRLVGAAFSRDSINMAIFHGYRISIISALSMPKKCLSNEMRSLFRRGLSVS